MPIDCTLSGILISASKKQNAKASLPRLVTVLGRLTFSSFVNCVKASLPIFVTPLSTTISLIFGLLLKGEALLIIS